MTTKTAEKQTQKKQAAGQNRGGESNPETPVTPKGRVHEIAKARSKPVTSKAPEPSRPQTPPTPTTDDVPEIVVFAFRLTRAERDEIHAATGSAKASRFVKAIVLAGARGDMKAVQEIVDEIHATQQ
jgi:hypothetical protein